MDTFLSDLINKIPVAWQPYVVLAIIVVYVITKIRSTQKTFQLDCQGGTRDIKTSWHKMVDWFF